MKGCSLQVYASLSIIKQIRKKGKGDQDEIYYTDQIKHFYDREALTKFVDGLG